MDLESITRWEEYSRAKDDMLVHTDTPTSPWFQVPSCSKKAGRINMIHHLLESLPYKDLEPAPPVTLPERPAGFGYRRAAIETVTIVPDRVAAILEDPKLAGSQAEDEED